MGSRGGGGSSGGGSQGIPPASMKVVQSLKEIVNGVPDAEIYSTLKDCNMDPNEAVNRLLSQDPFHEVKSKREKKKEFKDTAESRPRGGGGTSNRGARSGTDRYAGRSGSTQFSFSESGGLLGKPTYKRENGTSSSAISTTPASGVALRNANWRPPNFSDSLGIENEVSTLSAADGVSVSQPSSGYQSAWLGTPGQKSMADIVKMGRPQNKGHSTSNASQQSSDHNLVPPPPPPVSQYELPFSEDYASQVPEIHPQYDAAADRYAASDNEWPSVEQPQAVGVHSVMDTHAESELNSGQSNLPFGRSNQYLGYETGEAEAQDESSSEDHIENHVGPASPSGKMQEDTSVTAPFHDNDSYRNMDSYHPHNDACEHKEVGEGDAPVSSVSANMQKLNIQEERHMEQPEEDGPSVVIPNHLQVHTADCSHLSFGSFGANVNAGFSGPFASRTLRTNIEEAAAEPVASSVDHSETTNLEYYEDGSIRTSESNLDRTGASAENYDLPSASQTGVLKQENSEVTHGNQYGFPSSTHAYTFDSPQLLNPSFPQSQAPAQMQISTPFLNVMQAEHTNSLPSTLLAVNGHPVGESDLSYSQFSVTQSMPTRFGNSASSISGATISMAEALKTVGLSSSQPAQQTPPGNTLPTGPALPQHLAVHPYSQPTLPLGPFANMISYPFLPQSYTYMPSGFQPAFAGNSTYHQQLAAILPQYKNSVSVSSLPQSAAVASGYGSYGSSTAIPGNYQVSQPAGPAGSTISYDDALNAHYKDNNQLLSLQQNENSAMWVHGAGSRTMPGVQASAYYSLQSQNQQSGGFRQGQQPSQSYGGAALNYPDFFHSQTAISQELLLQQNPRGASLVGGSQGQPKHQSQQLWQNSY